MKKSLLLLSLLLSSFAHADQTTSGFTTETKTQVGNQAIMTWPSLTVNSKRAYIRVTMNPVTLGNTVCKVLGYKSGTVSIVEVSNVDFVDLSADGSIVSYGTPDKYFYAVSNAICSENLPTWRERSARNNN